MCGPSLWPLRQSGAKLLFYPINPATLQPDFQKCDELPSFDIFVLVHYFGKPADAAKAGQWARSRGALLLEDAAHVLHPINGVGEHGDFVLYSPRKLLPIPDGAFLVVRAPALKLVPEMGLAVSRLGRRRPSALLWKLRRSRLAPLIPQQAAEAPAFESNEPEMPMARTPGMSATAAALIARIDLGTVAKKRQQNAQAVVVAVAARPGWAPLFQPADHWIAHRVPMRCESPETAKRYFMQLREAGLIAETWPALAPEIAASSSAHRLRETVLLLPCHQHLNAANLGII
jgi:dTDP-4-amino-4,6-dideoxygalactose transaminase